MRRGRQADMAPPPLPLLALAHAAGHAAAQGTGTVRRPNGPPGIARKRSD
jgi:hypothetical protein